MAYTTYDFYQKKYHGDTIDSTAFDKWLDKATDKIDIITCDRLVDGLPEDERSSEKVQKAVCALADLLYQIDEESKKYSIGTDGTTGVVKSKSDGTESISYETGKSLVGNVITDNKAQDKLCYDIIVNYLSGVTDSNGVCLLYQGYR